MIKKENLMHYFNDSFTREELIYAIELFKENTINKLDEYILKLGSDINDNKQ
ncbi:MAG: hypothetical protein ACI4WW_04095 [Candidatus Coprovivens sp.]